MPKKKGYYAIRKAWGRIVPLANYAYMTARPVAEVWIHHSVTNMPNDYLLLLKKAKAGNRKANRKARRMEKAHNRYLEEVAIDRGFDGISYTDVVYPSGRVYMGRGFQRIGAHTYGRNSFSYGIVFVGNFELGPPSERAIKGAKFTINKGQKWHRIRKGCKVDGHRNAPGAATACPGRYLMARVPEIHESAA